jgi:hypothetical protein
LFLGLVHALIALLLIAGAHERAPSPNSAVTVAAKSVIKAPHAPHKELADAAAGVVDVSDDQDSDPSLSPAPLAARADREVAAALISLLHGSAPSRLAWLSATPPTGPPCT